MERLKHPTLEELNFQAGKTHLGMLIDPDKQTPMETGARILSFIKEGGEVILIGGSGYINPSLFHETVESVVNEVRNQKVIIFPGHIEQIPLESEGITGVLNYVDILGSSSNYSLAYPREAREFVTQTLNKRGITSIPTLYVLCGDKNASVSKASGIAPLNLSYPREVEKVLVNVKWHLEQGVSCVFFDTGSRSETSAPLSVVKEARRLIDAISPSTLLFVGGGVQTPDQAAIYKSVVNCISVGTYFEKHGAENTQMFLQALSQD